MELQQDDVEQLYDGREIRPPQRQCPTGRYTSDVCVDFCPAGTFADADSAACVKCFPGKANPESHATTSDACVSCAAGETSELGAASCTPCPAGTFSYSNGASRCTECVAGRYSSAVGATSTTSCQQVRSRRSKTSACQTLTDSSRRSVRPARRARLRRPLRAPSALRASSVTH